MLRAVVDPTILLQALIQPDGAAAPILARLRSGEYTLTYSQPLMDDLLAMLALPRIRNKYNLGDGEIGDLLALFALRGELISPVRRVQVGRDPKDDGLFEAALEGQAKILVTSNEDLLALKKYESVRCLTPQEFLNRLNQAQRLLSRLTGTTT